MSAAQHAHTLTERLTAAADPSDRRQALDDLVALARVHPAEAGAAALPVLDDLLQSGLEDSSISPVLMNLVLCVLLVPRYGGHGAAVATSISLAFETVLLFWIVRQRLGLHVLAFGKR